MAFEYRFNVIRFYSKLNRFVLSPRKKPNHFVLKIRPGGFADYSSGYRLFKYSDRKYSVWRRDQFRLQLITKAIISLSRAMPKQLCSRAKRVETRLFRHSP